MLVMLAGNADFPANYDGYAGRLCYLSWLLLLENLVGYADSVFWLSILCFLVMLAGNISWLCWLARLNMIAGCAD